MFFHSLEHGGGLPVLRDDDGLTACSCSLDERSGLRLQRRDRLDKLVEAHEWNTSAPTLDDRLAPVNK